MEDYPEDLKKLKQAITYDSNNHAFPEKEKTGFTGEIEKFLNSVDFSFQRKIDVAEIFLLTINSTKEKGHTGTFEFDLYNDKIPKPKYENIGFLLTEQQKQDLDGSEEYQKQKILELIQDKIEKAFLETQKTNFENQTELLSDTSPELYEILTKTLGKRGALKQQCLQKIDSAFIYLEYTKNREKVTGLKNKLTYGSKLDKLIEEKLYGYIFPPFFNYKRLNDFLTEQNTQFEEFLQATNEDNTNEDFFMQQIEKLEEITLKEEKLDNLKINNLDYELKPNITNKVLGSFLSIIIGPEREYTREWKKMSEKITTKMTLSPFQKNDIAEHILKAVTESGSALDNQEINIERKKIQQEIYVLNLFFTGKKFNKNKINEAKEYYSSLGPTEKRLFGELIEQELKEKITEWQETSKNHKTFELQKYLEEFNPENLRVLRENYAKITKWSWESKIGNDLNQLINLILIKIKEGNTNLLVVKDFSLNKINAGLEGIINQKRSNLSLRECFRDGHLFNENFDDIPESTTSYIIGTSYLNEGLFYSNYNQSLQKTKNQNDSYQKIIEETAREICQ